MLLAPYVWRWGIQTKAFSNRVQQMFYHLHCDGPRVVLVKERGYPPLTSCVMVGKLSAICDICRLNLISIGRKTSNPMPMLIN